MKKLVIKIEELPVRAHKLNSSDLERVFGGCGWEGDPCEKGADCCSYCLMGLCSI